MTASKEKMAYMNLRAYNIVYNETDDEVAQAYEDGKANHFSF